MPVPAACWDHSEASLLHDMLSLTSRTQKIGCLCALLHDPGWWSRSPAGTGDGYSRFLLPCSLLIRSHFLNPCPSAFFVILFGGQGLFAEGWGLLLGVLSHISGRSGRPKWGCLSCAWALSDPELGPA